MLCVFYVADNPSYDNPSDDVMCSLHAMQIESRMDLIQYLDRSSRGKSIQDSICPIKSDRRCPYIYRSPSSDRIRRPYGQENRGIILSAGEP